MPKERGREVIGKKQLLAMLLVSVLSSVSMIGVVVAPALPTVSIEPPVIWDPNMVPCSTFTVEIKVDYVVKLWAYQFELSFNPAVLECVDYANGPFLGSAGGNVMWIPGMGFDNTLGKLWLFGAALAPKVKLPTGGGVLATVTFHVVGIGESLIQFDPGSALFDKDGNNIIRICFEEEKIFDPTKNEYVWPPYHHPENFINGYFSNAAGPELYIRKRGAHGVSGIWEEWQVGPLGLEQTLYCRVMSYGRTMGAWVKVEFYVKGPDGVYHIPPYLSGEAWLDPATLVGEEWIPDEVVLSASYTPSGPGKYYVFGYLWFKAGGMATYYPFELTGLKGEGISIDINVAYKVTD